MTIPNRVPNIPVQVMLDRWDEPGSVAFTAPIREALRSHGGRSTLSSSASVSGHPTRPVSQQIQIDLVHTAFENNFQVSDNKKTWFH